VKKECNILLLYNGINLYTCHFTQKRRGDNCGNSKYPCSLPRAAAETEHDKLNLPFKPFLAAEKKRRLQEYNEANYILGPSEFVKRSFLEAGFTAQKLLKLVYELDKGTGKSAVRKVLPSECFTMLYVDPISVRKGIRYLIQTLQQLQCPGKQLVQVSPHANLRN
jgi:glycosyltransferase involved in cell wall biosynthesis